MKIIAHRGASGYAAENSLQSFDKAIEVGSWAIELDVRKCKSGELIISHDEDLKRLAGKNELVGDKTLEELKALKLKDDAKIITVQEALDLIAKKACIIFDIKEESVAEDLATILQNYVSKFGWKYEQFFATGFEHRELNKLKNIAPQINLVPSIIGTPCDLSGFAPKMNAYAICMIDLCISMPVLEDAKEKNIKVWIWLADEQTKNVEKFQQLGIDAIMVDFPDKAKVVIDQNLSNRDLPNPGCYIPTEEQKMRMGLVNKFLK